jgi:hypothetical protein
VKKLLGSQEWVRSCGRTSLFGRWAAFLAMLTIKDAAHNG